MPLKIPAPPREKFELPFTGNSHIDYGPHSTTHTRIIAHALREMSDDELTDLAQAIKGKRPMRVFTVETLAIWLRAWAITNLVQD